MKTKIVLGLLCLLCMPVFAHAGKEASVTSQAVFEDGGNDWRPISVRMSTDTVVLISTTPKGSLLDIQFWRNREIVNLSTCANLILYPDNVGYTSYSSSFSILLSSGGSTDQPGDIYGVPHQGAIYGVWGPGSAGCGNGGQGAGGVETYFNPKKENLPEGRR